MRCVHGQTGTCRTCELAPPGKSCQHDWKPGVHCPVCAALKYPTAPPHDRWVNAADALPVRSGWYRVQISGDEERDGAHVFYSYAAYETWAFCTVDEENEAHFQGTHDEETSMVMAWFGPVEIPAYKDGK